MPAESPPQHSFAAPKSAAAQRETAAPLRGVAMPPPVPSKDRPSGPSRLQPTRRGPVPVMPAAARASEKSCRAWCSRMNDGFLDVARLAVTETSRGESINRQAALGRPPPRRDHGAAGARGASQLGAGGGQPGVKDFSYSCSLRPAARSRAPADCASILSRASPALRTTQALNARRRPGGRRKRPDQRPAPSTRQRRTRSPALPSRDGRHWITSRASSSGRCTPGCRPRVDERAPRVLRHLASAGMSRSP